MLFHSLSALTGPGLTALIAESVDENVRGRAFSYLRMTSQAAWILGPLLLAWVGERFGYSTLVGFMVVMLCLLSFSRLALIETLVKRRNIGEGVTELRKIILNALKKLGSLKRGFDIPLLPLALILCLSAFVSSCFNTYLFPYLRAEMGLGTEIIGGVFSAQRFFVMIAYPVAGFLIDRLSAKVAFILDILGDGLAITLFVVLSRYAPVQSLLVLPFAGFFGEALLNVAYEVYTSKHEKRYLATAYAALDILPSIIVIISPPVWGTIWGLDPWLALMVASLVTFIGLPLAMALRE